MPTAAELLTPRSTRDEIDAAISDCIAQRQRENPDEPQEQSAAICFSMARRATGKSLLPEAIRREERHE